MRIRMFEQFSNLKCFVKFFLQIDSFLCLFLDLFILGIMEFSEAYNKIKITVEKFLNFMYLLLDRKQHDMSLLQFWCSLLL